MRRIMATVAVLAFTLAMSTACGDDEDAPDAPSGTTTKTINITFTGNSVTPNGERVEVAVDQPIELVVKAEEAGEIHVHSTPEQELTYGAGTTTLKLTISKPGIIDVESHDLEQTIVQLEVH